MPSDKDWSNQIPQFFNSVDENGTIQAPNTFEPTDSDFDAVSTTAALVSRVN